MFRVKAWNHLAFQVDDLDRALAEARAAGTYLENDTLPGKWFDIDAVVFDVYPSAVRHLHFQFVWDPLCRP